MPIFIQGAGPVFRPFTRNELDFELTATERNVVISTDSTSPAVVNDANVIESVSSTIDNEFLLSYQPTISPNGTHAEPTFEVIGAAAELINNERLVRVSNGTVQLLVKIPHLTKSYTFTMSRTGGATSRELVDYIDGSLAKLIQETTEGFASEKNATHLPVYSSQDHSNISYTRNTNCWLSSIDFTAVSPWNSYHAQYRAGVAISPRHTIHAGHFPVMVGTILRFITLDNQVITRTVTGINTLAGGLTTDTQVALLNSDLPETITPVKVFPSTFENYSPSISLYGLPVVGFDQEEKIIAKELTGIGVASTTAGFVNSIEEPFVNLTETVIAGDSGNPIFMLVGTEPVLLSLWTYATSGPAFHKLLTQINSAMTSLGGGYQLTEIDLSGFNDYS